MSLSLFKDYRQAAIQSGRPLPALLLEAARLRIGRGRLGLSEYIDFQLYLNDLNQAEKSAFGGVRAQAVLEEILIDDYSRFLSLDKVSMYALLDSFGFPIPTIRATYRTLRPSAVPQLRTPQDLASYLSGASRLPVYLKRSFGSFGRGNTLVTEVRSEEVVLGNGAVEPLESFCASLDEGRTLGWILQEPLQAHSDIAALTGSTKISGLRIHTFLLPGEAQVAKAVFKINAGLRDFDNFEHGATGNLLGAVDLCSGRITRAIAGVGRGQLLNPAHPVTGRQLKGFLIPYWKEVVELVTDAHKAFPGFLCPGWDVALCADGPRILEVNAFGDIDLSQHACRRGFMDARLEDLMRARRLLPLLGAAGARKRRSAVNGRLGMRKHHWPW